jgi:hypothetical protein
MSRWYVFLAGAILVTVGALAFFLFGFEYTSCEVPYPGINGGPCVMLSLADLDQIAGSGYLTLGIGVIVMVVGASRIFDKGRPVALALSLTLTIVLNMLAGILTILAVNGSTIVETNPLSSALLQQLGSGTLLVHAVEIAGLYPTAYLLSRAISSGRSLFKDAKRIYLFTFALLIAVLPAGAFVDLLSDVLVVFWGFNVLVGPGRIVLVALVVATSFAAVQVSHGWPLDDKR